MDDTRGSSPPSRKLRGRNYVLADQRDSPDLQNRCYTAQSKVLDWERERRDSLNRQADRLSSVNKAREDAVLKRLGRLDSPSRIPSAQGRRVRPQLDQPRFAAWEISRSQESLDSEDRRSPLSPDRDPPHPSPKEAWLSRRRKSYLPVLSPELRGRQSAAAQMQAVVDKMQHFVDNYVSIPRPPTAERFTPMAPMAPTPPPVSQTRRGTRPGRILCPAQLVQNDHRSQFEGHGEAAEDTWDRRESVPSPHPPVGPKKTSASARRPPMAAPRTPVLAPLAPKPPTVAPPKRREPVHVEPPKEATTGRATMMVLNMDADLQPLNNPVKSLALSLNQLSSEDWEKKVKGLSTIQALLQHHTGILEDKLKLREVSLAVSKEVKNLRSVVACQAMTTLAKLYVYLQNKMDPEVEVTGRPLLLRLAQDTSVHLHEYVNLALDVMVENCNPTRVMTVLLNTGLSHRCNAVRESMAQHLHQLLDIYGANYVMTVRKTFTERFLRAVAKITPDAAAGVRLHGREMLQQLAQHGDFLRLWTTIIPEKEAKCLDKFLKKVR